MLIQFGPLKGIIMSVSTYQQVIVVGAGIAGLTAAWQLKQSGIQALVLEAEQFVGGRMHSIQVEDALIDCGAQFLSNAYTIIPKLINETGLNEKFVKTKNWVGIVRNQDIALIHQRKPWHLVTNHILSIFDFLRLGFNQLRLFNLKKKSINLNDISTWTQYDNQLARNWVVKYFGETVAQELTAPIINGFYFQSLNDSSASMVAAVLAFSAFNSQTMTLSTGMGSLPQKLAEHLNVKTGVAVSAIIESSSGIKIISDSGEFIADHVILTVPAPIAKNIIQNPDEYELPLFETPYSSSATISLLTHNDWLPPRRISSVYGFLFNPQLDTKIAALTIENNKCITRKNKGYLINVMFADKWAKELLHLSDQEIFDQIQADVEKILPEIYQHVHLQKICRWQYAMPCTPIGRANAVKQYRDSRKSNNKIWLAGDYLGLPWTDSAAHTGMWAANQVGKYILSNSKK